MTGTEESGESPYAPPRAPIQPSDPVRGALERAQRAAVIAWWLTLLASVALTFITERWLPPELLAFVERQFAEELADSDWLLVAWLLAALVVALSGSVGTLSLIHI